MEKKNIFLLMSITFLALLIPAYLIVSAQPLIPPSTPPLYTIVTIAGGPVPLGDGGPATEAQLSNPRCLAFDSGYLYVTEGSGHRVRRVDLATKTITTIAGTGVAGFGSDGGPATNAQISNPYGIAVDSEYLYIADMGNNRVRRVNLK